MRNPRSTQTGVSVFFVDLPQVRGLHGEKIMGGSPRSGVAAGRKPADVKRVPFNIRMDKRTVSAMVRIYCRGAHGNVGDFCSDCKTLLDYAHARLERCPFGHRKTTCAKCPIHCYRPRERDAMRRVMRDAGRRMFPRHPWLTLWHAWQSLRKKPRWP